MARMTPETRLHLPCEVMAEQGRWWPGYVEHWRRRGDRWEGYVRYSTGVGELRIGWFDTDVLRRRSSWSERGDTYRRGLMP